MKILLIVILLALLGCKGHEREDYDKATSPEIAEHMKKFMAVCDNLGGIKVFYDGRFELLTFQQFLAQFPRPSAHMIDEIDELQPMPA